MIQGINTKTIIAGKTFKQIAEDRREEYLDDRTIPLPKTYPNLTT